MNDKILLSVEDLNSLDGSGDVLIVDCRFDLFETDAGRQLWQEARIPGARYAHLDEDLSSPIGPQTGRHPLPSTKAFAGFLSRIAWSEGQLVVAYDDGPGAFAARLWWLMRLHGQPAALLDGGFAAWRSAGLGVESGPAQVEPSPIPKIRPDMDQVVETIELESSLADVLLLDARTSDRFRGENEIMDTRAGHIPGAVSYPFGHNLELNGRFKPVDELREDLDDVLDGTPADSVVHSCGSGVSACHNLFAMELSGLSGSRLYAGSWSEWIRDPKRPIATGQ